MCGGSLGVLMQKLRPRPSSDLAPGGRRVEVGSRFWRRRLLGRLAWPAKMQEAAMRLTARCPFCLRVRSGSAMKSKRLSSSLLWLRKRWEAGLESLLSRRSR